MAGFDLLQVVVLCSAWGRFWVAWRAWLTRLRGKRKKEKEILRPRFQLDQGTTPQIAGQSSFSSYKVWQRTL